MPVRFDSHARSGGVSAPAALARGLAGVAVVMAPLGAGGGSYVDGEGLDKQH